MKRSSTGIVVRSVGSKASTMSLNTVTGSFDAVAWRSEARSSAFMSRSVQRTAVQLRPHQQTEKCHVATSEPVVGHHGREAGGFRSRRGVAVCCNGLLGGGRDGDQGLA